MKITIESPDQKGSYAELWEVHRKVGLFLKKNHLKSLDVYQPTHIGNTMVFEIKQSEYGDLVLDEIKSLLSSKTTWKIKENRGGSLMSEYYARCSCHPTVDTGTGEMCLNCKDSVCKTRRENGTGGYCNNSTRQADWFSHRKDVR